MCAQGPHRACYKMFAWTFYLIYYQLMSESCSSSPTLHAVPANNSLSVENFKLHIVVENNNNVG